MRNEELSPVVGDWVVCPRAHLVSDGKATIAAVLPRRTKISRKVAGARTAEQVVAANVDTVFLVMGLDGDYNLRRIERFMVMAWDSGASPVVLLNKADLCSEVQSRVSEVESVCLGAPVHAASCIDEGGLESVSRYLRPRETVTLLGSSGVGKSTLINRLMGQDLLPTSAVRSGDDRGRHTTTSRQLYRLPEGALLIDNPGIREIQLWGDGEGLSHAFDDIEELALECRFKDCGHGQEPECAVQQAVAIGRLPPQRLAAYVKLLREAHYLETRHDEHARRDAGRKFGRVCREFQKQRKRLRGE
jgi:ribosome biogenesis GTPase